MSSKVIKKTKDNDKVYIGLLTKKEREEANKLLERLSIIIPETELKLQNKYNKNIKYYYYLGQKLASIIEKENIPYRERLYIWKEISSFVSDNHPISRSYKRDPYEYAYRIYSYGEKIAFSMTVKQWTYILDLKSIWEDDRFLTWMSRKIQYENNIYFNDFFICLNQLLKQKDTLVFDNNDVYNIYDWLYKIVEIYHEFLKSNNTIKEHFNTQMKKKYFSKCLKNTWRNRECDIKKDCEDLLEQLL